MIPGNPARVRRLEGMPHRSGPVVHASRTFSARGPFGPWPFSNVTL